MATIINTIARATTINVTANGTTLAGRSQVTVINTPSQGPVGPSGPDADYFGVDRLGFTIARNLDGSIASKTYSNGVVLTYNRNLDGSLASKTSSTGKTMTYTRDIDGVLTGKIHS